MSNNITLDGQETHFQSVNFDHNLSYDCRLHCFAQFMNRVSKNQVYPNHYSLGTVAKATGFNAVAYYS